MQWLLVESPANPLLWRKESQSLEAQVRWNHLLVRTYVSHAMRYYHAHYLN